MKKATHYILMADIIESRKKDQKQLMASFETIVSFVNAKNNNLVLSPLTITMGDEFQGIAKNLRAAVEIIFSIEEKIIGEQAGFKLRYVLMEGRIDTPINEKIAYGMLGEGLTNARLALQSAKGQKERFYCEVKNQKLSKALNDCFVIYQSTVDAWNVSKDSLLILKFLKMRDYKLVADELGKTRSQMWKRQKSLKINEYIAIKDIAHYLT